MCYQIFNLGIKLIFVKIKLVQHIYYIELLHRKFYYIILVSDKNFMSKFYDWPLL